MVEVAEIDDEIVQRWINFHTESELKDITLRSLRILNEFMEMIVKYVDVEDLSTDEQEIASKYMTNVLFINHGIRSGIRYHDLKNYKYNIRREKWERLDSSD